jgi:hypothetical protein
MQEHPITQPLQELPIEQSPPQERAACKKPRRLSGANPAKKASTRGRRSSARPARGATRVEARRAQPLKEPTDAKSSPQPLKGPTEVKSSARPLKAPTEAKKNAQPLKGPIEAEHSAQPLKQPTETRNGTWPRVPDYYLKLGGLAVLFGLLVLIAVIALGHHPGERRIATNEITVRPQVKQPEKNKTASLPQTKEPETAKEIEPAASPKVKEAETEESASPETERLVAVPLPRKREAAAVPLPRKRDIETPLSTAEHRVRNAPPGVIISARTGARAHVGARYAARFQAYIDDLEANYGARVLFMGGIRRGHCSPRHEHPCGKALDVCQLSRGVVDRRCNLPAPAVLGRVAASHGLFEGGRWCDSDYGHAQVDVTAPSCDIRRARARARASVQRQTNEVSARSAHTHRRANEALAQRARMNSPGQW